MRGGMHYIIAAVAAAFLLAGCGTLGTLGLLLSSETEKVACPPEKVIHSCYGYTENELPEDIKPSIVGMQLEEAIRHSGRIYIYAYCRDELVKEGWSSWDRCEDGTD